MARGGFKIFDADTHVRPDADLLEPYLPTTERLKLSHLDRYKAKNKEGAVTYLIGTRHYKRRLGAADENAPENKEYMAGYKRHQHGTPDPLCERDPAARIKDMDIEGTDVNLMLPSGWFGAWTMIDDAKLETAVYEAYHRWMAEYCSAFPSRLKGVVLICARDVKTSVAELNRIPIWNRSGKPLPIMTCRSRSIRLRSCLPMRPAVWIPGTISGCKDRRLIRGVASATWRQSSAQGSWIAIRISVWEPWKRVTAGCHRG